jgi:hypothetical protein
MIDVIHAYEAGKPKRHPVYMSWEACSSGSNNDLINSNAEGFAPNTDYGAPGVGPWNGNKVLISDTDHVCGECKDGDWVWRTFMSGANIMFMDPYNQVGNLGGTPNDPGFIDARTQMGNVQYYANTKIRDLGAMSPQPGLSNTGYCLRSAGTINTEIIAYRPSGSAAFQINLSATSETLNVEYFNTSTGATTNGGTVAGGATRTLNPGFSGPAVVYLRYAITDSVPPAPPTNIRQLR